MFTGIIEETGKIISKKPVGAGFRMQIAAKKVLEELAVDNSISVDGVCQTVIGVQPNSFDVEAVEETVAKTTFRYLKEGDPVNLERPLRLSDRLGGHLVQGHVDGTARIVSIEKQALSHLYKIELPETLTPYVIQVGSIAVDGISLTVADISENQVSLAIIPYTFQNVTLGRKAAGDYVNIEVDIIGKYVRKMLGENRTPGSDSKITESWLRDQGY